MESICADRVVTERKQNLLTDSFGFLKCPCYEVVEMIKIKKKAITCTNLDVLFFKRNKVIGFFYEVAYDF